MYSTFSWSKLFALLMVAFWFLFLVVALVMSAAPARADAYLKAFGGVANLNDFGAQSKHIEFEALPETGYVYGVAIGSDLDFLPGAQVELEGSFRHADLGGTLTICGKDQVLDGSSGTFAAMFNVIYGYPIAEFRPYVFAGAGYAARRVVLEPTPTNWQNTSSGADEQGFAYQFGTGVDVLVMKGVAVGAEYRFFQGPHNDRVVFYGGKSAFYEADGDSHEFMLTVKVGI